MNDALKLTPEDRHRAQSDTDETVLIFLKGLQQQPPGYTLADLLRDARHPLWFTVP